MPSFANPPEAQLRPERGTAWWAEIGPTAALGLPLILGQAMHMLMHAIDALMVGRLGVEALAAAAVGNNAAALFYVVGVGLGSTVPVLAARAFGAGDRGRLNLVLRHGLGVSWGYGLAGVVLFAIGEDWILGWFGAPESAAAAGPYALLLIASLVPALLTQNLRGFAEAQNRPWLPLGNILLGVGLNIGLNFGLIYGVGEWRGFGLPGAALGTLIARCAMLGHFAWVLRRRPEIAPAAGAWRPVRGRDGFYREYFRLAVPTALVGLVVIGNMTVVTALMGRLGAVMLAANEIVRQVAMVAMTLPMAFSWAIAIRVGQAAGRGESATVRRIAWSGLGAVGAATCGLGGLIWLGRTELPQWFVGSGDGVTQDVAQAAAQILAVAAIATVVDAVCFGVLGVFRGLAAVRWPAAVYMAGLWLLGVPLGYWLGIARGGGGAGVWQGLVAGSVVAGGTILAMLGWSLARWPDAPAE